MNVQNGLAHSGSVFRACFGFRHSNFGFLPSAGPDGQENEEARAMKAGFSFQDLLKERRYAKLGYLLPMFPIEQAVEPGVSALPLR